MSQTSHLVKLSIKMRQIFIYVIQLEYKHLCTPANSTPWTPISGDLNTPTALNPKLCPWNIYIFFFRDWMFLSLPD